MNKVKDWLKKEGYDLNTEFTYEVGPDDITLSLDEVLTGLLSRMNQNEDRAIASLSKSKIHHGDNKKELLKDLTHMLTEFGNIEAHKDHNPLSWDQLQTNYNMDVIFLKWWSREKEITDHQMFCEHDDQDTYGDDGEWYNSVGVCKHCGCRMEDTIDQSESIELVYKAWNHSKI